MEALRKFSYDADVALFHEVLTGALCEDVYNDRNVMTNALEEYLPLAAGHKNLIGREDLYVALRGFPSKSEASHAALRKALSKDQSEGEFVDFVKLFEEDANLNQGEFVTLLSEQHWVEIRAYAHEVSDAIDGAERVEPGSNLAPLAAVREALRKHDPQEPRGRRRRVRARRAVCHLQQRRDAVRTRRRRGRGHVQDQAALQAGEAARTTSTSRRC